MGLDVIAEWMTGEWAVIAHAPIMFIASVLVAALVIWRIVQREFATRLSNAESRIILLKERLERRDIDETVAIATLRNPSPMAIQGAPPENYSTSASEREFVDSCIDVDFLRSLIDVDADIQAQLNAKKYEGKWISIAGFVDKMKLEFRSVSVVLRPAAGTGIFPATILQFPEIDGAIIRYRVGDMIQATGMIFKIDHRLVSIVDCELTL